MRNKTRNGTTLVELLVCLVFLATTVGSMCYAIAQAQNVAANAGDRLLVMGAVMDQIEAQRSTALTTALTTGTTTTTKTGVVWTSINLTTAISLVSGYTDLYKVDVTGTWGNSTIPTRNGSIEVITYMRAPHV